MAHLGVRVIEPASGPATTPGDPEPTPRPLIERIALAGIAILVAGLFGGIGVAALAGGEVFLGVMGGIGALMTVWAAASNLRRG